VSALHCTHCGYPEGFHAASCALRLAYGGRCAAAHLNGCIRDFDHNGACEPEPAHGAGPAGIGSDEHPAE
jgi:hypothetical protein